MKKGIALLLVVAQMSLFPLVAAAKEKALTPAEDYLRRSERADQWLFHEIPRHVREDLKETFFNPWHLAGLTAGVGLAAGIHELDPEIRNGFNPEDPLGGSNAVFNMMGSGLVLGGSTLLATVVSKAVRSPKATWTSGTMLEALAITYAITFPLKFATRRSRPDGSDSFSFPSAHASGAFALATVVESLHGPLYGVPSYALASMIALSRIDKDKHFASDTIAGALLGTLIGLGTAKFHKKERQDLFVTPGVVDSGMTLNLAGLF